MKLTVDQHEKSLWGSAAWCELLRSREVFKSFCALYVDTIACQLNLTSEAGVWGVLTPGDRFGQNM